MSEDKDIADNIVEALDPSDELGEYERESFVGMRVYSTNTPGFRGMIKAHFTDFVVQEISEIGEVLPLNYYDEQPYGFESGADVSYTKFILRKVKIDSLMAASLIANYLHVDLDAVSWAGIKDARAVTSQYFCVKGNKYHELKKFSHPNVNLYKFRPTKRPIAIGELWGNYFQIKITKLQQPVSELKAIVDKWCEQVKTLGVPNFYGLQRFGHFRPNSHIIGKLLFKKEYEEAINELLFKQYPYEDKEVVEIRKELSETKDYEKSKDKFHSKMVYERLLCNYLKDHPTDFKGAVLTLPYPFRNILLSSYQSYIFNRAISKRLEKGNLISVPIENDFVAILKSPNGPPSMVQYYYREGEKEGLDKAMSINRATVVAPILGFDQNTDQYGSFKEIYDEILKEEGIDHTFFNFSDFKSFKFRGTYRPICIKIADMDVQYNEDAENPENEFIELKFRIPKGSYATVVLRELLKIR